MIITIARDIFTDQSTGGVLTCGDWTCYTLELPWMGGGNFQGTSAIPEGQYKVTIYDSPHLGFEVLLLHDVPGRDMIEVHPGNVALKDSNGCILVGLSRGEDTVESSRAAFTLLRGLVCGAILAGEEVFITIRSIDASSESGSSMRS